CLYTLSLHDALPILAFVAGVPAGALAASRLGWHWVFACLSAGAGAMFAIAVIQLPSPPISAPSEWRPAGLLDHFRKPDRFAGMRSEEHTSELQSRFD